MEIVVLNHLLLGACCPNPTSEANGSAAQMLKDPRGRGGKYGKAQDPGFNLAESSLQRSVL